MNSENIKKESFKRHLYKVMALFFSLSLWFYVLNSEPMEAEKSVHVEFLVPKGLAIANIFDKEIKLKLKGSRAFMRNLFSRDEKIYIDLNNFPFKKRKELKVTIDPNDIPLPFGVNVLEISPDFFTIKLEKEIRKKVSVSAMLVGGLPLELKLMKSEVRPSEIMIKGPIETMRKTGQLSTIPIDMSSLNGEGSFKVGLADLDSRITLEVDEENFEYFYEVKPKKANLTLKNIDVRFLSSAKSVSSKVRKVSLDVLAPENIRITKKQVEVIADIPSDAKGNVEIKLEANLPEGVHLLQINPEKINVRVRR